MLLRKWRNLYIEIPHICCWSADIAYFDLLKIVKMMTIIICCSGNLANGVNDNYCSIFLQSSSVSSSLRDLGKQIAGSKLPAWHNDGTSMAQLWYNDGTGLAQLWYNDGTTLALRRVSRFLGGFGNKWPIHRPQMPSTYVSRPKKFPGLRTQLPIPGFGSQDLVTPVATSIKLWRLKSSEECLEPGFEISHGATLDY